MQQNLTQLSPRPPSAGEMNRFLSASYARQGSGSLEVMGAREELHEVARELMREPRIDRPLSGRSFSSSRSYRPASAERGKAHDNGNDYGHDNDKDNDVAIKVPAVFIRQAPGMRR